MVPTHDAKDQVRTQVTPSTGGWTHEQVDQRERTLARALGAWSAGSVVTGALVRGGAGRQHAAWGAVDGALAATGLLRGPDRRRDPGERAHRLRRLLLVNAGLDVGYLALGATLRSGRLGAARRADGGAVLVQGAFLLGLDLWHARALQAPPR